MPEVEVSLNNMTVKTLDVSPTPGLVTFHSFVEQDPEHFAALWSNLARYGGRFLGDGWFGGDDVVQLACWKLLRRDSGMRQDNTGETVTDLEDYLYQIVKNAALDYLHRGSSRLLQVPWVEAGKTDRSAHSIEDSYVDQDGGTNIENDYLVEEESLEIRAELCRILKPDELELLLLAYDQNLSHKDIAVRLGTTESAVKTKLNRTREKVRDNYGKPQKNIHTEQAVLERGQIVLQEELLAMLVPRQREALIMKFNGADYSVIGQELGINANAAKELYRRSLRRYEQLSR